MANYREKERHGTIREALRWLEELLRIAQELNEAVGNVYGTNLDFSERIRHSGETANAIDALYLDSDIPDHLAKIQVSWIEKMPNNPSQRPNRNACRDNALAAIRAVMPVLLEYSLQSEPDRDDYRSDEEYANALRIYEEDFESREEAYSAYYDMSEWLPEIEKLTFPKVFGR